MSDKIIDTDELIKEKAYELHLDLFRQKPIIDGDTGRYLE